MPDRRHNHKNTQAYPLSYNGSFTWNTKTRRLCFMRCGDPHADREEMRNPTGFMVEGDDIKRLYQVLHDQFMAPHNATRNWDKSLPEPPNAEAERKKRNGSC